MKASRRKMNGKNSGIANGVLKKHSGKSGNAVIPDGAASITRRAFYTCKRLLTAPKKKNAHNIKAGAVYCAFDEKKQAFIVPDGFLDDWDA